jgi:hypothetical protein
MSNRTSIQINRYDPTPFSRPGRTPLTPLSGHIASLTSGLLAWIPSSSDQSSPSLQTTHVPSPVLALASHSPEATSVALAGKEVDVSLWDVERTFAERPAGEEGVGSSKSGEPGEIWRAKNVGERACALQHTLSIALALVLVPALALASRVEVAPRRKLQCQRRLKLKLSVLSCLPCRSSMVLRAVLHSPLALVALFPAALVYLTSHPNPLRLPNSWCSSLSLSCSPPHHVRSAFSHFSLTERSPSPPSSVPL